MCVRKTDRESVCVIACIDAVFFWKGREGVFFYRADKILIRGVYSFRWANECVHSVLCECE